IYRMKIGTTTLQKWVGGLSLPAVITFGPDGNLYVANYGDQNGQTSSLIRITPRGVTSTVISGWPGLDAVAFDAQGNLFTANWPGVVLGLPVGATKANVYTT